MNSSRPHLVTTTFVLLNLVSAPALAQEESETILPQGQLAVSAERLVSADVTVIPTRTHVTHTDEVTGVSGTQEWSSTRFDINPGSKIGIDYLVWKGVSLGVSGQYTLSTQDWHSRLSMNDGSPDATSHSTLSIHNLGLGARLGYAISGTRFGIWPRAGVDHLSSWIGLKDDRGGTSKQRAHTAAFTGEVVGLYKVHDKLALSLAPYITLTEQNTQLYGLWAGLVILP